MKRLGRIRTQQRQRGTAMLEWLIILTLVTFGACIALAPLGRYLLGYHDRIEFMTELPLP